MSDYELQSHKKSDSIKWIIAFVLIALLCVGMIVSFVRAYKDNASTEEPRIEMSEDGITAKLYDNFSENNFKE